ncbi:MAG: hypothetical protein COT91_00350, partial [Candidatus Doudnabacteria bacterium CG10_big_fil_rev_8_21_14_0_10_41_10]
MRRKRVDIFVRHSQGKGFVSVLHFDVRTDDDLRWRGSLNDLVAWLLVTICTQEFSALLNCSCKTS